MRHDEAITTPVYPLAQPNGSLLAYLFADRLLPASSRTGLSSDGWRHQIAAQSLAVLLYSVALWSLREQRFIAIEHGKASFLRSARTQRRDYVDCRLLHMGAGSGLEGCIVELLGRDRSKTLTPMAIKRACKGAMPVQHEAVAVGYQRTVSTEKRQKNWHAEFVTERVAELEPAFADFNAKRSRFRIAEPDTFRRLQAGLLQAEGSE